LQKHYLALQVSKKNQITKELKVDTAIESSSKSSTENSKIRVFANQVNKKSKEKISFDVIVYKNKREKQEFDRLINEFSEI
jgi:hypothetical protein